MNCRSLELPIQPTSLRVRTRTQMTRRSLPPPQRTADWYSAWGKRAFDLAVGSLMLLLLLPVIIFVSILVAVFLGRPVFFRQQRPGKSGRLFEMIKFRSMTNAKGADGNLLPDDQRLTRFGAFLRASSIDEFPELWNVMKGEMSLVGPRPLLIQYLDRYSDEQFRRHEVAPGVTGWAQINGRNSISWDEKFSLDLWYVDHYSLWVDVKILFLTVVNVLRRSGISADGHATMPEFSGNGDTGTA